MVGGNGHSAHLVFTKPPSKVVSLVPSLTQSIIDLGCGETLVGVTKYCPRPEGEAQPDIIGGTHAVDIETIKSLEPDLIVANQEENEQGDVEALEAEGLKVWVTFPRNVYEAIEILWALARLYFIMKAATPKILLIERSLEWAERGAGNAQRKSVFVPIWQDEDQDEGLYWMTFNGDTYCDSVLSTCGGLNVFHSRRRNYPLGAEFGREPAEDDADRDTRYPRVGREEIIESAPEIILLPSEPFLFTAEDIAALQELLSPTPAVKQGRIYQVDGRWLSWHGTMLAHALVELPPLFD